MLFMGALAPAVGAVIAVVSLLGVVRPTPGLSLGYGLFFVAVGVTFSVVGFRGFKMRSRRDLNADIAKTTSDRDQFEQWINR